MEFNEQLCKAMQYFTTNGAFLTVKSAEVTNTMTISWGLLGFLWQKPHLTVLVRPQRYTKPIIDSTDSFTVSIPFGGMREALAQCGSLSGRDVDKSKIVNFLPAKKVASAIVEGCQLYVECKIVYRDRFDADTLPADIKDKFYNGDYHYTYMGEIVACYAI